MTRSGAQRLREIIEEAVQSLDDETAEEAAVLFPKLDKEEKKIVKGKRYYHNGKLKKAKKDFDKHEDKHFDDADFWEELPPKHKNEKNNSENGNKDN